ncbi:MAG: glutamine synthetase type III, partial [Clostridia bacterium]|nr:glutamine synthetase type III [Clostridia bacterium]
KFEFRMLGSSISIAEPNIMLNTIVAEEFKKYADELEKVEDVKEGVAAIIKETVKNHKRIIFNGNNYSDEWVKEAENRGLLNLRSTPEAILRYRDEKNIDLFTSHKIFTKQEVLSRCEILLENYTKVLNVEALTMVNMAKQEILPAIFAYEKHLAETASVKRSLESSFSCKTEAKIISKLATLADEVYEKTDDLADLLKELKEITECEKSAFFCKDKIVPAMETLRKSADEAEELLAKEFIPYPTYADLLFSV